MADAQLTPEESAEFSLDITACAVAEAFTDAYYYTLEKDRSNIHTFYCPKQASGDSTMPFIAWNSEVYNEGTDFQTYFEGLTHTHYDIEALDCTILNPRCISAAQLKNGSGDDTKDLERRMSVQIVVTGSVRLEEPLKGPMREFAETFVLVPNLEKTVPPRPTFDKGWDKEWVIQTQNFKFTEWGASEVPTDKMEEDKTNGEKKGVRGGNKGIASQFAAAGLFIKGKGKA